VWRREKVQHAGKHYSIPLPADQGTGLGKPLKIINHPVRDRIPIVLAAIGPKNVALTGEIADGWLPVFLAPEHLDVLMAPLEEGAQRAGRTLDDFDIAPTVNVLISDDVEAARDAMRPILALYVGGMGSREKNFYNALVQRYGFEDAAREVQDLYLDGKKEEAAAALPAELIDTVTLCGPEDRVRDRLAVYAQAGVGTLGVSPMAFDAESRLEQLKLVAELAEAAAAV
jgi:F420-dependent oxidoreductase-like protein